MPLSNKAAEGAWAIGLFMGVAVALVSHHFSHDTGFDIAVGILSSIVFTFAMGYLASSGGK